MFVKKFTKLLFPFAFAAVVFSAGCGGSEKQKNYTLFTNMPDGQYSVIAEQYTQGGKISGYTGDIDNQPFTPPENYSHKRMYYNYMFADAELIVADDFTAEGAEAKFNEFSAKVNDVLKDVQSALSSGFKNSDIWKFNEYVAGAEYEISAITYEVLSLALSVHELTGGYYNPALYYNIQEYGFNGSYDSPESAEQMPDDKTLSVYTEIASHFNEITLREENGKYFVKKPDYSVVVDDKTLTLKLDLGGIGKGYAVDKIDRLYDEYGYNYGYFNFGASSMLLKSHPQSGDYTISLVDPRSFKHEGYINIPARNVTLSTSGDNEQYFEINGKRYCHIIDPFTGKPVQNGIMSATVLGGNAGENDALTTAIMCMSKETAIKFIEEKLTDKKVVFTYED